MPRCLQILILHSWVAGCFPLCARAQDASHYAILDTAPAGVLGLYGRPPVTLDLQPAPRARALHSLALTFLAFLRQRGLD